MKAITRNAIEEAARLAWADGDYESHTALNLILLSQEDNKEAKEFWGFIQRHAVKVIKAQPKP